jgi:hypothetical protein
LGKKDFVFGEKRFCLLKERYCLWGKKILSLGKKVLKIPKKFPKNFLNVVTRAQKPLPRTLGDKGGVKGGGSVLHRYPQTQPLLIFFRIGGIQTVRLIILLHTVTPPLLQIFPILVFCVELT